MYEYIKEYMTYVGQKHKKPTSDTTARTLSPMHIK